MDGCASMKVETDTQSEGYHQFEVIDNQNTTEFEEDDDAWLIISSKRGCHSYQRTDASRTLWDSPFQVVLRSRIPLATHSGPSRNTFIVDTGVLYFEGPAQWNAAKPPFVPRAHLQYYKAVPKMTFHAIKCVSATKPTRVVRIRRHRQENFKYFGKTAKGSCKKK